MGKRDRVDISLPTEITDQLFSMADEKYRVFQSKLIPNISPETIIGVRTPQLRQLCRELKGSEAAEDFLRQLPHKCFEENQLHSFLISADKDFSHCIERINIFLPFIDNWATCDQLRPVVFRKHHKEFAVHIEQWLKSDKPYTIRFALGMIMAHFLDDDFDLHFLKLAAEIRSDEYYVNMMTAWLFATALAKKWDETLPFTKEHKLDSWTHNKTIQKARESLRVPAERKDFLKEFVVKNS